MKGFISIVLVFVMAISLCTTSFAAESNGGRDAEYQLTIDGMVYTVTESYNGNEKVVKVTDGNTETMVTLNDDELNVYSDYGTTILSVEELKSAAKAYEKSAARTTATKPSKIMYKAKWLIFIIAIWIATMGGLLWLWARYRKQYVGVSRVALIGIIVINLLVFLGIYAVTKSS